MKYTVRFSLVMAFATVAMVSPSVADTVNWTGGGDGHTFADLGNWDGDINDGDSLVIENGAVGTTLDLTNDLGSAESPFKVHSVTARGMGTVHISGNPIEPSCASWETNIVAECSLVTDFDIKFPAHASLTRVYMWANTNATWRCNGAISGTGQTALRFATSYSGRFDIYGDVSFPNGSINTALPNGKTSVGNGWEGYTYFYGKCSTAGFNTDSYLSYMRSTVYFSNEGNDLRTLSLLCRDNYCAKANVLSATTVVKSWYPPTTDGNLYLQGYDQTIDHLAIGNNSYIANESSAGHKISGSGSTLTIACSVDNTTNDFSFADSVNAVWAPLGNYTCTFRGRKHTTSGRIAVKRGTMAFLGATEFTKLSEIEIAAGAKFSLAEVSTASPLPAIKTIWLENGTTSILTLPENRSVANVVVFVDGVPLDAGTYTGAGGTAENVVDWIEGKGVVTVVAPTERYFTGVNSSRWADAGNWSDDKLPTNDVETVVTAQNVTVPSDDDVLYNLNAFPSAANATTPTFTVRNGGKVTVSGGSLVITNITGKARIGGDDASSVTSRLEVTSGTLGLYATRHDSFAIGNGGIFSMTGGNATYYYPHGSGNTYEWMFRMLDGVLDLSGDAEFEISGGGSYSPVFGTGVADVRGDAALRLKGSGTGGRGFWTPATANGTLTVNFSGNAVLLSTQNETYIGGRGAVVTGAKTVVNAAGNSTLSFGSSLDIGGSGMGSSGELNIADNAVVSNSTNYGIFVGKNGTAANPATGKIKMTGGVLKINANNNANRTYGCLNFGCDSATEFTNFYNRGSLEMSGGAVTNKYGFKYHKLVVGSGNSYGEILQSDGIFCQGTGDANIGWYGGTGLYRFTGGSADFSNCDFIVGADGGKGTLEIGAGTGTFASKNLNLAGSDATLKFKIGADGTLATLGVTGTFTIASGAKLVVDASECADVMSITLMTFGIRDGEFAKESIEVVPPSDRMICTVQQLTGKICFTIRKPGLVLVVK